MDFFQAMQITGAVLVALPGLLSAVIMVLKAIPGEQGEKFLEEKVKPLLDKLLSFYGLLSKKKPEV